MILAIFLALSWVMPSLRATLIRYSLPEGFGSPGSRVLSETPRLTSLSLKTSRTALARSSLLARMSTPCSPDQAMEAPTPRKSNRVPISLAAWLSALSTSWRSSLETMSKEESCAATAPRLDAISAGRHAERALTQGQPVSRIPLTVRSRLGLSFWMPPALRHTAGCPSGQRERSVKPSAQPTLVRTQHLPLHRTPAQGRYGVPDAYPGYAARCQPRQPDAACRGIYAGSIPPNRTGKGPGRASHRPRQRP